MSNSTRCAACKYLRRRCAEDCVLAPYFPASHPERFASVHRIFGASNVSRMLQQNLPAEQRGQAADAIASEAYWRVRDPVYGSVGVISLLQQQIYAVQSELAETQAQIALHSAQQQQHRQRNQVQLENHPYGLDDSQHFGLDQGPAGPQNPPNFP